MNGHATSVQRFFAETFGVVFLCSTAPSQGTK